MRIVARVLLLIGLSFVMLVAAIVVALALLCLILFLTMRPHPPSDEELIENYTQHRQEFDQLATMLAAQDSRLVVFPDSEQCQIPGRGMIDARDDPDCAELVQRFRLLGLKWAYAGDEPLWLPVYGWGLTVSALRKGYLYTTDESWLLEWGPIVDSTEESCCCLPCFRRIDTNWYIYLDD